MSTDKKLLVLFPGIGYHMDKPLLYYSKKLGSELEYEITEVAFNDLPSNVKGDKEKMHEAYVIACEQAYEQLKGIAFDSYDSIVCISKSLGTTVAATVMDKMGIVARHVYMTPVPQTMNMVKVGSGIVIHGLADSWCPNDIVDEGCNRLELELMNIEDANHSLETGIVHTDLKNLDCIMNRIELFLAKS